MKGWTGWTINSSWIHKKGEDTGKPTTLKTEETGKYKESKFMRRWMDKTTVGARAGVGKKR